MKYYLGIIKTVHKFEAQAQTCELSSSLQVSLVNFMKVDKFAPKLVNFLNNTHLSMFLS